MLVKSNARFILQGIRGTTTFESLRKLIFKYYGVDYDNIMLSLYKDGKFVHTYGEDTLQRHQFIPYRDYLIMHWTHNFWDTNTIYGINLYRICLSESVNYDNMYDTNYQKCKYGINPLRLNRAAIDKAIDIVESNSNDEIKKLDEVKTLRCFVPKQILDPHADGHRMNIIDNTLSDPWHNISYFTMFNHVNPNALFDQHGTNKIHIKNKINADDCDNCDQKEFKRDYNDNHVDNFNIDWHSNHGSSKSICVYSNGIITISAELFDNYIPKYLSKR